MAPAAIPISILFIAINHSKRQSLLTIYLCVCRMQIIELLFWNFESKVGKNYCRNKGESEYLCGICSFTLGKDKDRCYPMGDNNKRNPRILTVYIQKLFHILLYIILFDVIIHKFVDRNILFNKVCKPVAKLFHCFFAAYSCLDICCS